MILVKYYSRLVMAGAEFGAMVELSYHWVEMLGYKQAKSPVGRGVCKE